MTLLGFRRRFAEFEDTADGAVLAALNAAFAETSAEAFGDSFDEAHGLLAAHKLALGPFGTAARMITSTDRNGATKTQTVYEIELCGVRKRSVLGVSLS